MMHSDTPIELARKYVALSNNHDLESIRTLFAEDATYQSAYFGEYKGSAAIHAMMIDFFDRFSEIHWEVTEYREIENNGVQFSFIMTGKNLSTGEAVKRHGLERIYFRSDGLIRHISVLKPEAAELPAL